MLDEKDYLAHHGTKGQRWGLRRYQNQDGSLTEEGRRRYGVGPARSTKSLIKEQKKKERAKKAEEKRAKKAEADHESLKNYVREHPKALYRHRTQFSAQEIDDIVKTIQTDRKLKDIRNEESRRQWERVQEISNNLGKLKNLAENAKGVYNLACEVNNTLIEAGTFKNGKRMLKVGEKAENKNDNVDKWFDTNLKADNYTELLKNMPKLSNVQLEEINKRYVQQERIKKNFGSNYAYEGKHLKHCLAVRIGDFI